MNLKSKSNLQGIMRRLLATMLLLVAVPFYGIAQDVISGTVTDETGEPLIGVSVVVKGSKTGVNTNLDGKYSIKARKSQSLEFSYVGMQSQSVSIGGRSVIDVVMKSSTENLDDVIVVGYGKQKKSTITGSVSAIKGDELLQAPSTQLTQLLGGKVAGISSIQTSGSPHPRLQQRRYIHRRRCSPPHR